MTPETVMDDETRGRIVELVAQARSAHQVLETTRLKHADPGWATWYAGFLLERGFERIWPNLGEAELAGMFQQIDREYQAAGTTESWPEFAAARLVNGLARGQARAA